MPMKTILQDTHPLDAAGVDNISEQIADVLADYPYITKRDILRLRLSAEEILLHWRQEAGALRVQLSIEEKGRWIELMLRLDGVPYRLAPPAAAETSGINGVEGTLANLGIDWIYQFDHGQNSAYISVEAKESHRVRHVLTAMVLAVVSAALLRLLLPFAVTPVQTYVTAPLLELCSKFLTAVVTPMMLLAVISGVLSVGSPRTFNQVGRFACVRFLFSMLVVILCAGAVCAICFPLRLTAEEQSGLTDLGGFLAGIVPDNALSPLIDSNMLQIVFVGFVVGMAMLFLQRRVGLTAQLVDEAGVIVLKLLTGFERVLPGFVFLSMLSTGLTSDVDALLSYGRMILLFVAFSAVITAVQLLYVSRRLALTPKTVWAILRSTFMAQLASACSSSAFSDAYDACERGFGIDTKLVRFALPIGTVIHKPLIAAEFVFVIFAIRDMSGDTMTMGTRLLLLVMAFLTSVAYPPVSGGEISCYTILLLQMGMSSSLLAVACSLSALFDTLEAPCNTLCTELQLLLTARKHNLMTGGRAAQMQKEEVHNDQPH